MRICKISICNLNSLRGLWEIDLQAPEYVNSGLFAICGPTGAGKTTILDAIALALYGRTPRLPAVNKGSNEVMARGTGECSAEVIFEAAGERYKAHWSQRRAHGKPDGQLQNDRPELSRLAAGQWEILATKKTDFAKLVASITGLTYEEFSRSILLAQGNFATFLKASKEDRSAALEKLTGTEVYSEISKRVQQKTSEFNALLEHEKSKLEGVAVLSVEERQAAVRELDEARAAHTAKSGQHKKTAELIARLETIAKAAESAAELKARVNQAKETLDAALLMRPKLDAARKAAAGVPLFEARIKTEFELKKVSSSFQSLTGNIRTIEVQHAAQKSLHATASDAVSQAEKSDRELAELLKSVRSLDQALSGKAEDITREDKTRIELKTKYDQALRELAQTRSELAKTQAAVERLTPLVGEDKPEAKLLTELTALNDKAAALFEIEADLNKRAESLARTELQLDRERTAHAALVHSDAQKREALRTAENELAALQKKAEELLQGRELSERRNALKNLSARGDALAKLTEKLESCADKSAELDKTREDLAKTKILLEAAEIKNAAAEKALTSALQAQKLWEEKRALKTLVEQFADTRSTLSDGSPCPLCGAVDHPYCRQLPEITVDVKEQQAVSAAITRESSILNEAVRDASKHQGRIESLANTIQVLDKSIKDTQTSIVEAARALELEADGNLVEHAAAARESLAREAAELTQRIEAIETNDNRIKTAANTVTRANKVLAAEHDLLVRSQSSIVSLESAQKLQSAEISALREKRGIEFGRLSAELARYAENVQRPEDLAASLGRLAERAEIFGKNTESLARQKVLLTTLTEREENERKAADDLSERLKTQTASVDELRRVHAGLLERRRELFGERVPDDEQSKSQRLVANAKQRLEAQTQALTACAESLTRTRAQLAAAGERQSALGRELQETGQKFAAAVCAAGFADESTWAAARLPQADIEKMAADEQAAQSRHATLASELLAAEAKLAALRQAHRTERTVEELRAQASELEAQINAVAQTIGALDGKLKADEEARLKRSDAVARIEARQKELDVWSRLNAMIGSFDGKRYREFVQSITFGVLLNYANEALGGMTDRYRLKTNDEKPLNIDVIDNYQGGAVRTSDNLSGGESFIVSLSLALALSRMASRNVHIDSLFLDEGFGTLDPDSLDAALNSLANLNRQGKLIGIISHVGEIRDRIPAHIEVIKGSAGVSRLEGPGVRRL